MDSTNAGCPWRGNPLLCNTFVLSFLECVPGKATFTGAGQLQLASEFHLGVQTPQALCCLLCPYAFEGQCCFKDGLKEKQPPGLVPCLATSIYAEDALDQAVENRMRLLKSRLVETVPSLLAVVLLSGSSLSLGWVEKFLALVSHALPDVPLRWSIGEISGYRVSAPVVFVTAWS